MSDAARERLRALLGRPRSGTPERGLPSATTGGANAAHLRAAPSVRERLARRAQRAAEDVPTPDSALSLDAPRALARESTPHGDVWARRVHMRSDDRHGEWTFGEVRTAERDAIALAARDARLAELDLADALYLDTETTGLSGGAGTYVFLVGIGSFDADGFSLWQGFLRGPEEEYALLSEVARRVRAAAGVVTFFGKSFDRHRLEDRMRVLGIEPPFGALAHLDLYHPLRRLYGGSLPDLRLRTVEAALCGIERAHDLPGSFAPAAWFDFVARRPHRLEGVFEHNAADVASLAALAAHLGRARVESRAHGAPLAGCARTRAAAWARLCSAAPRDAARATEAVRWFERALERGAARALALDFAVHLARTGDASRALALAHACSDAPEDEIQARAWCLRASLERRRGDSASALTAARQALSIAERTMVGVRFAAFARECRRIECAASRPRRAE
ncbi:MAG: ribonuclease H-like domain-containing protein [Planctomycetota bacterium]